MLKSSLCIGTVAFLVLFSACKKENKEDINKGFIQCDTTNVRYSTTIVGIMNTSCATQGCHATGSNAANLSLDKYAIVKIIADNGKLLKVINHQSGVVPMPSGAPKLDECSIAKIKKWVDDGAQNN